MFRALIALLFAATSGFAQDPKPQPDPAGATPGDQQHVHAPLGPTEWKTGEGNRWFEATRLHLGNFFQEQEAVGKFKFKNPTDDQHRFSNLIQSCACAKSVIRVGDRVYELTNEPVSNSLYRITRDEAGAERRERVQFLTVNGGEAGEVEVHMTMGGHVGDKDATLDMTLDDAELPAVKLSWRATGAAYFVIDPPEWNLGEMTWRDRKEFSFKITSPIQRDFELLRHDALVKAMQVEAKKEMQGDAAVWTVKGSYGPGVDERDGGGPITFHTDVQGKSLTLRVIALVKGPLEMTPGGFLSLGRLKVGEGGQAEVRIKPTDDFDLQIQKLEPVEASELVTFASRKEQKDIVIEIRVAPGAPKGKIVRGVLRVHLNHPSAPLKEIQFNGFVR
jgi:hypothetical protein